ncbi:zinc-binding alcohol dehydrogenase family protein [Acinetobacter guillouiae]|uniref:zinc-binding alcohol dehydrogenase family protein n=1 Tax=Acinetobacter guillouiae TaxID=106649 RepID=UPI003AF912D9
MKAVAYKKPFAISETNVFSEIEIEQPVATGHDLLIEVKAISINPVDVKIRQRTSPDNDTWKILGHDAVGIVKAIGEKVQNFKVGDEVFYAGSNQRQGSYAEYQLVDERIVGLKPKSLSDAEAAALPLTSLTAYEMLFDRLKIQDTKVEKPVILVIGAAGGVGSITVQLLKVLTGFTVIATASRPESKAWLTEIGADHIVDHSQPLEQQVLDLNIGLPNYIFSINGTGRYTQAIANLIAPQGHFGLIDDPENFIINPFKVKSVSVHWESMFTRSTFQTKDLSRQGDILNKVSKLVDDQRIKTTLGQNLGQINVEHITQAHTLIESGKSIGKIVLAGF